MRQFVPELAFVQIPSMRIALDLLSRFARPTRHNPGKTTAKWLHARRWCCVRKRRAPAPEMTPPGLVRPRRRRLVWRMALPLWEDATMAVSQTSHTSTTLVRLSLSLPRRCCRNPKTHQALRAHARRMLCQAMRPRGLW